MGAKNKKNYLRKVQFFLFLLLPAKKRQSSTHAIIPAAASPCVIQEYRIPFSLAVVFFCSNMKDWGLFANPGFQCFLVLTVCGVGLFISGIVICTTSAQNYVCPEAFCSGTDSNGNYDSRTLQQGYGPCGKGFSGSTHSSCTDYCGESEGVVCATRDYSCGESKFVSDYYCSHALLQCNDVSLALILSGSLSTFITIVLSFYLCCTVCCCSDEEEEEKQKDDVKHIPNPSSTHDEYTNNRDHHTKKNMEITTSQEEKIAYV